MELMVGCALGAVAVGSYLTLRDVLKDLQREGRPGALVPVRIRRNERESRLYRAHLYRD